MELLGKCKWLANLLHGQHVESLMVLHWSVANMLQDSLLQVWVLQDVFGGQLLCHELGLFRQEWE